MSYQALRDKKNQLIRKATDGSSFLGPITAPLITSMTMLGGNEIQTVTITGSPTGGTYTLTFMSQTTSALAWNANAAAVQAALIALSTIGVDDIVVTGGPGPATPFTVTWSGPAVAGASQALMTASGASLTGGTTPSVVVAQVQDGGTGGIMLRPLHTSYEDLGFCADSGHTFSRNIEISEVNSFGSVEPTRSDTVKDTVQHQVTAQETKLLVMGLVTGVDPATVIAAAGTGEVGISKSLRPSQRFYRNLTVFVDENEYGEIYMGKWMPRVRVQEVGDEQYSDGDDPVQYPLTFQAFEDSVAGFSMRWLWGGAGFEAMLADMGITQAP